MFFEKFFGWGSSSEQHQQKPLSEKEPFSDTSLQQPNHQTPLSISVTAPDFGYQILGVANGSPAAQAGLIPYFDYIVAIEKQPVVSILEKKIICLAPLHFLPLHFPLSLTCVCLLCPLFSLSLFSCFFRTRRVQTCWWKGPRLALTNRFL